MIVVRASFECSSADYWRLGGVQADVRSNVAGDVGLDGSSRCDGCKQSLRLHQSQWQTSDTRHKWWREWSSLSIHTRERRGRSWRCHKRLKWMGLRRRPLPPRKASASKLPHEILNGNFRHTSNIISHVENNQVQGVDSAVGW
jgi:hypothetical protein